MPCLLAHSSTQLAVHEFAAPMWPGCGVVQVLLTVPGGSNVPCLACRPHSSTQLPVHCALRLARVWDCTAAALVVFAIPLLLAPCLQPWAMTAPRLASCAVHCAMPPCQHATRWVAFQTRIRYQVMIGRQSRCEHLGVQPQVLRAMGVLLRHLFASRWVEVRIGAAASGRFTAVSKVGSIHWCTHLDRCWSSLQYC